METQVGEAVDGLSLARQLLDRGCILKLSGPMCTQTNGAEVFLARAAVTSKVGDSGDYSFRLLRWANFR